MGLLAKFLSVTLSIRKATSHEKVAYLEPLVARQLLSSAREVSQRLVSTSRLVPRGPTSLMA